jgi:2-polyprenyl-3-methyl-5-hydroxy-6-metoxy-1,4-benzoquinol methylase
MTESIFDERARKWDTPGRIKLAASVATAIRSSVKLDTTMTLLDFGAGTGLLSLDLRRDVKSIIAVDESSEMLSLLREKAAGDPEVKIIPGDYRQGALEGVAAHVVVSSMVLHHVADYAGLLKVLAPLILHGGIIAMADLEPEDGTFHEDNSGVYHFGFSREEMMTALTEAGFREITYKRAMSIPREQKDGSVKAYGVFLTTAKKL